MVLPFFLKYTPPSKESVEQRNRAFRAKHNLELELLCEQLNSKIREARKDLCCTFSVRYYEPTNPTQDFEAIGLIFNLKWRSERKFNYSLQYMLTEHAVKSKGIERCVEYIARNIADFTINQWREADKFRVK